MTHSILLQVYTANRQTIRIYNGDHYRRPPWPYPPSRGSGISLFHLHMLNQQLSNTSALKIEIENNRNIETCNVHNLKYKESGTDLF